METYSDPAAVLGELDSSRQRMANRLATPPRVVGMLAAGEALVLFSCAFPWDGNWAIVRLVPLLLGSVLTGIAMKTYRTEVGVWVNPRKSGPRGRRGWWQHTALTLIIGAGILLAHYTPFAFVIGTALAVALFVTLLWLLPRVDRAVREDLAAASSR